MTPEKRKASVSAKAAENAAPMTTPPPKKKYNKTRVEKIYAKKPPARRQSQPEAPNDCSPGPSKKLKTAPLPVVRDDSSPCADDSLSIAESGVLEASLKRSRMKWLHEDILERYWIANAYQRNRQQKNVPHPRRDTMREIGPCHISVEPHVFDATLYVIRGPRMPFSVNQPSPKPVSQSNAPPSEPASRQSPASSKPSPSPNTHAPSPVPSTAATGAQGNSLPPLKQPPTAPLPPLSTALDSAPTPPQPPRQTSQDPVIQMLAQRASANPSLKELMKTVASGTASKHELDVFQSHIDDLTSQYNRQNQYQSAKLPPVNPTAFAQSPFRQSAAPATPRSPFTGQNGIPPATAQQAIARPQPAVAAPKPKSQSPSSQEIGGVAIDFAGGSGDRYLFPKYSILEYINGNKQVKVSFLSVRRGSSSECGEHDVTKTYHTPVTFIVSADSPAVLEPLSRAVAPAAEVRKHMEDAMTKTTRADDARLAIQQPYKAKGDDFNSASAAGHNIGLGGKKASAKNAASAGKRAKHEQDIKWDQLCGYCYAELPASQAKTLEGVAACQSCKKLRRQNGLDPAPRVQFEAQKIEQSRGPRVLIF